MIIMPSIDLEGGEAVKRVRGSRGTGLRLGDPLKLAERLADAGFKWIHVVSLDSAERGSLLKEHMALIAEMAAMGLKIQYGGGIRSAGQAAEACSAGAQRLVIGSAWPSNPGILDEASETGCGVLAALDEDADGFILSSGWRRRLPITLRDAVRMVESTRAEGYLYTQTWVEGTMRGPEIRRAEMLRAWTPRFIAYAGGVSSMGDVERLDAAGVDAVVIGMALYTGGISMEEAARHA